MRIRGVAFVLYITLLVGITVYLLSVKNWDKTFIVDAVFFGIITSIIGSFAFIFLLTLLRPSIKISPLISMEVTPQKETLYYFQIKNNSLIHSVYNVELKLFLVANEKGKGKVEIDRRITFKNLTIDPHYLVRMPPLLFSKFGPKTTFYIACGDPISDYLKNGDKYLELQVMGKHPFSGFSSFLVKTYHNLSSIKLTDS